MVRHVSRRDLGAALGLLGLLLAFFWEVTLGGKTLLPIDVLFAYEPWRTFAPQFRLSHPQNPLLADLILESYPWKAFLVDSLRAGQIPFWNPYILGGMPFWAAGQHSALYPLSALFFLLPLPQAFGYFTLLNLFLGGLFVYIYLRVIGSHRFGAVVAALCFAFSSFAIASVVFPMVLSAAVWLPLILACVELVLRRAAFSPTGAAAPRGAALPYILLGGLALGMQFWAGHIEISLYILLTTALYAAGRLLAWVWQGRGLKAVAGAAAQIAAMAALGGALGAVQLVPLYELARQSFRQDGASYAQVVAWAFRPAQALTFLMPDFWGNPTHTAYFDLWEGRLRPVENPFGYVWVRTLKNYVEAASYLGLLPLLLAAVAIGRGRTAYTWLFFFIAVLSLLWAFGTPLYALLYYLVPGWTQVHTPFRWVYPYTLAVSVLAGLGAHGLSSSEGRVLRGRLGALVVWGALLVGGGLVIGLILTWPWRGEMAAWGERLLDQSPALREGFASGRLFYSFQFRNLALFGLFLAAAGGVLGLARSSLRLPAWLGRRPLWQPAALAVVVLELFAFGRGFNPATDPRLLDFIPPAIQFLKQDQELYRITGYGDDSLHPNAAMIYGLSDLRGYDSLIPQQYAQFAGLIEEQWLLAHNRIARLREPAALDSPLLDLANAKYVVTTQEIARPGYTLVYDGEVRIYRREAYLPRAFIVPQARVVGGLKEAAEALRQPNFNPRQEVVLEKTPGPLTSPAPGPVGEVKITRYTPNEVRLEVRAVREGILVVADSYFPGWRAWVDGQEREILRANYNFRGLYIEAGSHQVVFQYRPLTFLVGLFVSLLALAAMLLGWGYWLWGLFYREAGATAAQRVAKNSLVPMATSLFNKALDMGFAVVMLRVLGPEGLGKYTFAIVIVTYFEVLVNFGLDTIIVREVAKDPAQGNRYLNHTVMLRFILWLLAAPVLAGLVLLWNSLSPLGMDTLAAIALLGLATLPSHAAAALSRLFYAHERMELPAAVTVFTTLVKIALGLPVLLMGGGFVGLAAVAVVNNLATMGALFVLVRRALLRPQWENFDPKLARQLLQTSYPLMLNSFLAMVFFRADVLLLQAMRGALVVGWYGTAYKFLDMLNIIPSAFTLALFPLFARYAATAREALGRAYAVALKYMLIASFPLAAGTSLVAEPLVLLVGGPEYLPHAAWALRLVIWFLPLSFVNGVSQYVLIALNEQRFVTFCFLLAAVFNISANLILIPLMSYQGAALVTILTEGVLLVPFWHRLRRHLGPVPLLGLSLRPALAAALMALLLWPLREGGLWLVPLGAVIYGAGLLALGTFGAQDRQLARQLVGR